MKPIDFLESNKVLTSPRSMTDEEYGRLPVFNDEERSVSCWKMGWKERLRALITGEVWLMVWGGKSSYPVCVMVDKPLKVPAQKVKRVFPWPPFPEQERSVCPAPPTEPPSVSPPPPPDEPERSIVHTNPNPKTRPPLRGVITLPQGPDDSPYPQDQERRIIT